MTERNGPRRRRAVQARARRISKRTGWGYGKAMRAAGWQIRNATGNH